MDSALAHKLIRSWMASISANASVENLRKFEGLAKARLDRADLSYRMASLALQDGPLKPLKHFESRDDARVERRCEQHRMLVLVRACRLARAASCQLLSGAQPTAAARLAKHLLQYALRLSEETDLLDESFSPEKYLYRSGNRSIISAQEAQALLHTTLTAPPEGAYALVDPELNPNNLPLSVRIHDYRRGEESRKNLALLKKILDSGILTPEEADRLKRELS